MEIWKSLKGIVECGDNYEVSTLGQIRNVKTNKVIKNVLNGVNHDYLYTPLNFKGKKMSYRTNRLVALAFIPNPDDKSQVNHIDGNKLNNHVSNLEWTTAKENVGHAWKTGLNESNLGSNHHVSKLTEDNVVEIKKSIINGVTHQELAEKFNVCCRTIACIQTGLTWKHVHVEGFTPFTRSKKGEGNKNAKLTEDDVVYIKKSLVKGVPNIELARQFNVTSTVISGIQRGTIWKHVKVKGFKPFVKDQNGEGNTQSKLNEDNVREIKKLYKTGEYSSIQLGKMFKVSKTTILYILNGKLWAHVD